MKSIFQLITVLLVLTSFIACGGGGSGSSETPDNNIEDNDEQIQSTTKIISKLKSYNLSNADSLLISSSASSSSAPKLAMPKKSYADIGDISMIFEKVESFETNSGKVEVNEVEVVYEEIEVEIDSDIQDPLFYPYDSINIDANYILTRYNDGGEEYGDTNYPKTSYIVNKSSGLVSEDIGRVEKNEYGDVVQSDPNSSFYAIVSKHDGTIWDHLVKMTLNSDGTVDKTQYSYANDSVFNFLVDGAGNILYNGNDGSNYPAEKVVRYIKSSGGVVNVPAPFDSFYFTDLSDNLIFSYLDGSTGTTYTKKFIPADGSTESYGSPLIDGMISSAKHIKNRDAIVGELTYSPNDNFVVIDSNEVSKQFNTSTDFNVGITLLETSDNYYYIYGEDPNTSNKVLKKINPVDDSIITLFDGTYALSKMSVTSDDRLSFIGTRTSDSKEIIGEISSTGVISEVQELASDKDIVSLEAINN